MPLIYFSEREVKIIKELLETNGIFVNGKRELWHKVEAILKKRLGI